MVTGNRIIMSELSGKTVAELKRMASKLGIRTSRMKKAEIIEAIREVTTTDLDYNCLDRYTETELKLFAQKIGADHSHNKAELVRSIKNRAVQIGDIPATPVVSAPRGTMPEIYYDAKVLVALRLKLLDLRSLFNAMGGWEEVGRDNSFWWQYCCQHGEPQGDYDHNTDYRLEYISEVHETTPFGMLPILCTLKAVPDDNYTWYKYCWSVYTYEVLKDFGFGGEHDYYRIYTTRCVRHASVLDYVNTIKCLKNPEWYIVYKPHDPIKGILAKVCGLRMVILLERQEDKVVSFGVLVHQYDLNLLERAISPWTDMDPLEVIRLFWCTRTQSGYTNGELIEYSTVRDLGYIDFQFRPVDLLDDPDPDIINYICNM